MKRLELRGALPLHHALRVRFFSISLLSHLLPIDIGIPRSIGQKNEIAGNRTFVRAIRRNRKNRNGRRLEVHPLRRQFLRRPAGHVALPHPWKNLFLQRILPVFVEFGQLFPHRDPEQRVESVALPPVVEQQGQLVLPVALRHKPHDGLALFVHLEGSPNPPQILDGDHLLGKNRIPHHHVRFRIPAAGPILGQPLRKPQWRHVNRIDVVPPQVGDNLVIHKHVHQFVPDHPRKIRQ